MATKAKKTAAKASESSMVAELCQKHGYTMMANKPGRRTTMVFDVKKRIISPFYVMVLAVPMDSELAKQMIKQFPVKTEKKRP